MGRFQQWQVSPKSTCDNALPSNKECQCHNIHSGFRAEVGVGVSGGLQLVVDDKPQSGSLISRGNSSTSTGSVPVGGVTMGAKGSRASGDSERLEDRHGRISLVKRSPNSVAVKNAAVVVRNAVKRFGNGPDVLNDFNMTVKKGTIYSLLGASGCGKTTLLSCVVGIKFLNKGDIKVFGGPPTPGRRIGYMPQETALYNVFSIREALSYFGTIFGMSPSEINTSRDFLIEFLDLPNASRRIGTLSGGQKRRVSLACSLVHNPELLILDEPTVGVDPLLRESIWNHLCKLVSTHTTTVIITTHYIEEARQSNTIGLMRNGRLLEEKSPEQLLREYNTTLLEDIVLQLCRKDRMNGEDESLTATVSLELEANVNDSDQVVVEQEDLLEDDVSVVDRRKQSIIPVSDLDDPESFRSTMNRLRALITKNVNVMTRNLILLIFMIFVPAFQIFIICLAIGNDPKPMRMGFVNHEVNYSDACLHPKKSDSLLTMFTGCDIDNLSCKYLAKMPPDTVYLQEYANEELARDAVKNGRAWGFMTFPKGFSDHMYTRSASGNIVDNETLEGSQIYLEMDLSNKQIAGSLKKIFYDSYTAFVKDLLIKCGFHPELGDSPIKYRPPIYGKDDTDFREYVAPSVLLGVVFFFPLCSSGISYIWDKKQGTLERALVAGVRTWEIMAAFFCTEGIILLIQAGLSFSIVTVIFGIQIQGSTLLAIALTILLGLGGVSMGFLIASFCNEEIEAVMLAMASFFPNLLLAGMIWPTEGMPIAVQYFSYLLPCTLACESIRSIISRGWPLLHANVWPGFATATVWIIVYWTITIFIHKILLARK